MGTGNSAGEATMGWRHTTWARWLSWTLVFWVLVAGFLLPLAHPVAPGVAGLLVPACFVASFVAAFAIGVRFRSPWWAAGPPTAVLTAVLVALALPDSGPAQPGPMGNMTQKDEFVFMLVWGGWIVVGLIALVSALAWAGVRVGERRNVG